MSDPEEIVPGFKGRTVSRKSFGSKTLEVVYKKEVEESTPQVMTPTAEALRKTVDQNNNRTKRIVRAVCIICEFDFQGEVNKNNQIQCPNCSTAFNPAILKNT